MQRGVQAKAFEAMVHDLRVLLRWSEGKEAKHTAVDQRSEY